MTDFEPGTVVVGYLDDGHWSACFGLSYRDMLLHDMCDKQRIVRKGGMELRNLTGSGGIPQGRNEVCKQFLRSDGEWLFFIDTDMGFAEDTVDALVECADPEERPVVGGLCFCLKKKTELKTDFYGEKYGVEPTLYKWVETEDEVGVMSMRNYPDAIADKGPILQVAATGAACLLIHRSILVKMKDKYGPQWFSTITHPTGDKGEPRTFSEDLSFCVRVAAIGGSVHINTDVKTTHEKGGVFLDEAEYVKYRRSQKK